MLKKALVMVSLPLMLQGCGAGMSTGTGGIPPVSETSATVRAAVTPAAQAVQSADETTTVIRSALASSSAPARIPLGVNLEVNRDWSRSMLFVDAMKSARRFGTAQTPWDMAAPVDANGWPTSDFGVVVMSNLPHATGTYNLAFIGTATLRAMGSGPVTITGQTYDRATGITRAQVNVGASQIPGRGTDSFLGFSNTQRGVRGMRLIRPGYPADTTQIFTTPFLNRLRPFSALRPMWLQNRIDSPDINWSDRAKMSDAQQTSAHGVALE
ncbi:MAG: hypothetical protein FJX76_17185 [Armatimonadetes bacterium]|nr:hypothetical protein [Armatimonadota bacterium]